MRVEHITHHRRHRGHGKCRLRSLAQSFQARILPEGEGYDGGEGEGEGGEDGNGDNEGEGNRKGDGNVDVVMATAMLMAVVRKLAREWQW